MNKDTINLIMDSASTFLNRRQTEYDTYLSFVMTSAKRLESLYDRSRALDNSGGSCKE